jgi:hypothetical protein
MTEPNPFEQPASDPDWRQHLQIVFSVLVGVAFAQAFSVATKPHLSLSRFLLVLTVFYVALDCWYNLNFQLIHFRRSKWWDLGLYLLALVFYSCLPFLYFAQTKSKVTFGLPELLMFNLSLICVSDAVRRTVIVVRTRRLVRKKPSVVKYLTEDDMNRFGTDTYFLISGYAFGLILFLIACVLRNENPDVNITAAMILISWLAVRTIDHFLIKSLSTPLSGLVVSQVEAAPDSGEESTAAS